MEHLYCGTCAITLTLTLTPTPTLRGGGLEVCMAGPAARGSAACFVGLC